MVTPNFVRLGRRKRALLKRWRVVRRRGEGDAAAVSRTGLAANWPEDKLRNAQRVIAELNAAIDEELRAAHAGLASLETLNKWLRGLRREEQSSLRSARKALKAVFINIFDLLAENYGQEQRSRWKLRTRGAQGCSSR